jgi:hypothetical protein
MKKADMKKAGLRIVDPQAAPLCVEADAPLAMGRFTGASATPSSRSKISVHCVAHASHSQ